MTPQLTVQQLRENMLVTITHFVPPWTSPENERNERAALIAEWDKGLGELIAAVQLATVEHLRHMTWDGHRSPWFHMVADKLRDELLGPGKQEKP